MQRLQSSSTTAESRPSRIGPINLGMKQTGERSEGNPHAAFDVAGTGNVARSRCCDTSQPKGRGNREHKLRPKPARQSPTLPRADLQQRSIPSQLYPPIAAAVAAAASTEKECQLLTHAAQQTMHTDCSRSCCQPPQCSQLHCCVCVKVSAIRPLPGAEPPQNVVDACGPR